jgi:hypothetical protein
MMVSAFQAARHRAPCYILGKGLKNFQQVSMGR